jgi:hypothetical protein
MKTLNGRVNATNERLEDLRTELKAEVGGLRTELRTEVGGLRAELRSEVAGLKAEMSGLRGDIDRVHRGSVERDVRLATSLAELACDVRELTLLVHDWRDEHRLDRGGPAWARGAARASRGARAAVAPRLTGTSAPFRC